MPRNESTPRPAVGPEAPPAPSKSARGVGVAILVAAYAPLHRLLDPGRTGPAGVQTRAAAEAAWTSALLGSAIVLVLAAALTRFLPDVDPGRRMRRALERLADIPIRRFAPAVALLALGQAALVAWAVHRGHPTSVDEVVQLLHARTLAGGTLTLSLEGPQAAWTTLNGVVTPHGWASIYPPLHTAWLSVWLALGVSWLAGPVAVAAGVGFSAAAADAVLGDPLAARLGGLLLAFTPYVLLLGGTHLSHATAMALLGAVMFTAARARDGGPAWAVATGAAVGAAVCARPWVGLVAAAALLTALWVPTARAVGPRWATGRLAALTVGGVPFAAVLFGWNQHLFGSPFRLGYTEAFGPAHGLGFHRDPWGNLYGPPEALGYTGADLTQLGAHLLETPLPALALVALALMLVRLPRGSGVVLAWAGAGVVAAGLYWHHGVHMGPRMLFETAPAWVLLWSASAVALTGPGGLGDTARRGAAWVVVVSLVGAGLLTPGVVAAYRSPAPPSLPAPPGDTPALVFVHGSWSSRVANRLSALGMRRDSVETALRRNDLCAVELYARGRRAGAPPPLALDPLPGTPSGLVGRELAPGVVVRADPTRDWDEGCMREAAADRLGTVELEPLAWRGDGPGGRLLLVRDLGPAANAAVLEAYPERTPWVWMRTGPGSEPSLRPYDEGMEVLWMGAATRDITGGGSGS